MNMATKIGMLLALVLAASLLVQLFFDIPRVTAAVFIVAVLITLLLVRGITSPLGKLVDYAEKVKKGDYTADLVVKGEDEVAKIASSVKSLVQQVAVMRGKEEAIFIGSMKDGLIVLDRDQRIIRVNPAIEQMVGFSVDEVLGKSISELEADLRFFPIARLSQVQSSTDEVVLVYPTDRVLKVHPSRLKSREGKDLGEVRVVIDVTQERELDQMKSDFIANTSHELRTPLHSIRGFVKLILDGQVPDSETQREFLTIIDEESLHLNNLVNDILDISAMESGKVELERQSVSMKDVVDNVVLKLQKLAADKEITIETNLPDTISNIEGDSRKLEQVMTNLVSNAIKFSSMGGKVFIRASAESEGVLVQVADEGTGIAADAIPCLFQKFSQVDSSITRKQGGTGLGLYITKQIVEAHGGKIWVESKPNEGTTFFFVVPLVMEERKKKRKVGEILVEEGLITEEKLIEVLRKQES